jgi:DNA polymerase III epsilon subunit-like protein
MSPEGSLLIPPAEAPGLHDLSFAVLDLETTGGRPKGGWNRQDRYVPPSEITEVGVMLLQGPVIQDRWESLCAIEGVLPQGIQRLTGITLPMLATAPAWERVALVLAPQLEGRLWVAHHAPFDGAFLKVHLPEGLWKRHALLCTRLLARGLVPEAASWSLANLCQLLGVPNRRPHRALPDAEATAELLQLLLARAEAQSMTSDQFLRLGLVPWENVH